MAKKKTLSDIDSNNSVLNGVFTSLVQPATWVTEMKRTLIPWSPSYDSVTGGGVVSGSVTNIKAKPKIGKTQSLLHLVKKCQKPEYGGRYWGIEEAAKRGVKPGRPVVYANIETRITKRDLYGHPGMNYDEDKFGVLTSTEERSLYTDDYIAEIEKLVEMIPGIIIVVDSVGAMCSKKIAEADAGEQVRDITPILVSYFMKRLMNSVMPKDAIILNVLHVVANTGATAMQSKSSTTGGVKLQYAANNYINIKYSENFHIDETSAANGKILHLECETSELGAPDQEATGYLKFGRGLWEEYELLSLVTDNSNNGMFGITKKGAGWFTFDKSICKEEMKFQGAANAAKHIEDNPKIFDSIYSKYRNINWPNTELYLKK